MILIVLEVTQNVRIKRKATMHQLLSYRSLRLQLGLISLVIPFKDMAAEKGGRGESERGEIRWENYE